jgi:hypothetical protein
MHHKYARDGLVCTSVAVDDKDDLDKDLKFLRDQKAEFASYLIDEPAEVWQKKLDVAAPPAVIVFGRDGKRVKTFTSEEGPVTYGDVEKLVAPLLKNSK